MDRWQFDSFLSWVGFCFGSHPEEHLRNLSLRLVLHGSYFARFHQFLSWLSCLHSPTFRHAVKLALGVSRFWDKLRRVVVVSCLKLYVQSLFCTLVTEIRPMTPLRRFPAFLSSAPSMTWLRNGVLVFDSTAKINLFGNVFAWFVSWSAHRNWTLLLFEHDFGLSLRVGSADCKANCREHAP